MHDWDTQFSAAFDAELRAARLRVQKSNPVTTFVESLSRRRLRSLRRFPFLVPAITEIASTRWQTTVFLDALDGR